MLATVIKFYLNPNFKRLQVQRFLYRGSRGHFLQTEFPPWKQGLSYNWTWGAINPHHGHQSELPSDQTFRMIIIQWRYYYGDSVETRNSHKLNKYVVKFRGHRPQTPIYLLIKALYSYFEFNSIQFRFTPDQDFNIPVISN